MTQPKQEQPFPPMFDPTPDQPARLDPGSPAWECAREILVARMREIDRLSPDNGYLARDAQRLRDGELGHIDTWIALDCLATLSTRVEALTRERDEAPEQLRRIDEEYGLDQVELCQLEDECAALEARAIAAEAAAARLQQGTTHD